jgi:hypothetical protein
MSNRELVELLAANDFDVLETYPAGPWPRDQFRVAPIAAASPARATWRRLRSVVSTLGANAVTVWEYEEPLQESWWVGKASPEVVLTDAAPLDGERLLREWTNRSPDATPSLGLGEPDSIVGERDLVPDLVDRDARADRPRYSPDFYSYVVVVDCPESWMVPAFLGFDNGGSNTDSEHVAVLRFLEDRFGAVLAGLSIDRLQLALEEPLTPVDAHHYGPLLTHYAGPVGLDNLVRTDEVEAYLRRSTVWTFYWD